MRHPLLKYIRENELPFIFCPGCGSGIILRCTLEAMLESNHNLDEFVLLSGSGCNGWIAPPFNVDVFHTNHGRPIAYATGVKIGRPDLKVIVFTGDGDSAAIGGNHLIHAARRNIDMLVICINNSNYGMTGGQLSPTTPFKAYTMTSPYGNPEPPFDLCKLVEACGASFVARWTTAHPVQLKKSIAKGLSKKGFAFIDVISQCPTQFGRRLGYKSASEMVRWFKKASKTYNGPEGLQSFNGDQIPVGEFIDRELPEFTEVLRSIAEEASQSGGAN